MRAGWCWLLGLRAMKHSLLALTIITLAGCSRPQVESPYCRAISAGTPTRALAVRGIYIYGTLEHGTIVISPQCLQPVFNFYSFQDSISAKEGAMSRIRTFNEAVYNSPAKTSGVFEIDGVLNVDPASRLVELYDITDFREVDEAEGRSLIHSLRQSRK